MLPDRARKTWWREVGNDRYMCSTDPDHIQLDKLNTALGSDMLWWAKPLPEDDLKILVNHSLCVGLYVEQQAGSFWIRSQ
jgi:hypothetical protein